MNAFPPANAETARLFARLEGCTCAMPRVTLGPSDSGVTIAVVHHKDGCPLDPGDGQFREGGVYRATRGTS